MKSTKSTDLFWRKYFKVQKKSVVLPSLSRKISAAENAAFIADACLSDVDSPKRKNRKPEEERKTWPSESRLIKSKLDRRVTSWKLNGPLNDKIKVNARVVTRVKHITFRTWCASNYQIRPLESRSIGIKFNSCAVMQWLHTRCEINAMHLMNMRLPHRYKW